MLVQEGFTLLHDDDLRTALWVSYRLFETDIEEGAEAEARVDCFRKDPRLTDGASKSDYDEPIFDQGHMANDADMKDVKNYACLYQQGVMTANQVNTDFQVPTSHVIRALPRSRKATAIDNLTPPSQAQEGFQLQTTT